MADRFYGYQYDTNPRKLNYDYAQYRKKYPQQEEPVKTTNKNRSNNNARKNLENKRTNKRQYDIKKEKLPNNGRKQVVKEKNNKNNDDNAGKMSKASVKAKLKIVMYLVAGFSVLFAIGYQNSLISESFNKKEQLKKEMEALAKTNQQIEVGIENNLNLNHIEQAAKEQLGMQKLNNNQKIYVSLPKEDYVAPAAEQVVIEDEVNFFQKLVKGFTTSIK
ncbi:MAG: hypothetical protein K6B70_04445 [Clostridia bacterium]|nr:hypothetical protein [Clostridia bacterium]